MAETKSAAQQFAEQKAREAISRRYVDPTLLDPDRQEQINRNRLTGQFAQSLSVDRRAGSHSHHADGRTPLSQSLAAIIRRDPLQAMIAAVLVGFAAALVTR